MRYLDRMSRPLSPDLCVVGKVFCCLAFYFGFVCRLPLPSFPPLSSVSFLVALTTEWWEDASTLTKQEEADEEERKQRKKRNKKENKNKIKNDNSNQNNNNQNKQTKSQI